MAKQNLKAAQELAPELINFKADIDQQKVEELEKAAQEFGYGRRLALLSIGSDRDKLASIATDEPEAFEEMLLAIENYKAHAEGLSKMAEAAYIRMIVAGAYSEHSRKA
ncbi:hypothetical protein [Hydrogenophaga sp.]|uniref:hypothetical protein n=1 Tax=Hydrogenophaga sp. TaxID=1904254 RepID=UPI0027332EFB|nr:hypothetical protein [Hydrogenophaga sp.]MDP3106949.1 hypothetical protein [Hydrogenophaga sp.]